MKYLYSLVLLLAVLFMACFGAGNTAKSFLKEGEVIYWINTEQKDCQGVGRMKCLEIQKGEERKPDGWSLFYSSIEGFQYEPGYIYKLIVKEEKLPADQVPAGASRIRYKLVKQLQKNK